MIPLQMLQDFFAETRQKGAAATPAWSIDGTCRWSYFFVDQDGDLLVPVAEHLQAQGYEFVGITEPDDDEDPYFYLQLDRVEQHTPESLHARVQQLYALAEESGIADYDGMDVGPA